MTFKQIMRRYWYWFMTIPLLVTICCVWLFLIGAFDIVKPITISTNTPKNIDMYVDSTYHMVVTSDSDRKPTYSSSRPYVVEVDSDGFLISHDEGIAVVTVDFGVKKYNVTVSVFPYTYTWYLTTGDSFTQQDVYDAFPEVEHTIQSFSMSGSEYVENQPGDEPGRTVFTVTGEIAQDALPFYVAIGAPSEKNPEIITNKGQLTVFLVQTQDIKAERTAAYEQSLAAAQTPITQIPDRVDEALKVDCGYEIDLKPHLETEGYVTYMLQDVPDGFPAVIDQRGIVRVQALLNEFYVVAVVSTGETWRWRCTAVPQFMDLDLVVGEEVLLDDIISFIPTDVVRIECASAKIKTLYNEDGLMGFRALEATEQQVYVNCYSSMDENYIIYRIAVSIKDESADTEEENG